jgi:hypothetical protein
MYDEHDTRRKQARTLIIVGRLQERMSVLEEQNARLLAQMETLIANSRVPMRAPATPGDLVDVD